MGPRLPADLLQAGHLLVEVVHHDLGLEADGLVVVLDVAPQLLPGPLGVELRVALHRLDQLVVAVHRRVVRQHVDDEALLDRLLHGVGVEGHVPDLLAFGNGGAEDLQGLVLGGRGEGEVAGVGQQLLALHDPIDLVLGGLVFFRRAGLPQRHGHGRRGPPALTRMGLVNDEGERVPAVLVADRVEDVRELLHRGDDDPLAVLEQGAEMARVVGMSHDGPNLRELLDGVLDLLVQHPPVRHHDHRIDERLTVPLQPDQLVGQPGDGVGLAAAGRVLNQILVADSPRLDASSNSFRTTSSWW